MFTGIISSIGTVRTVTGDADRRMEIGVTFPMEDVPMGASIACSGCCLTVVEKSRDGFCVDVSAESLAKTTLGGWRAGTRINLERALKMGDELGGHIVSGHVDGLAELLSVTQDASSWRLKLRAPPGFARFVAPKGSVALDGISLTVNEVEGETFGVNIIPFTWAETTLGGATPGDRLNFEVDMLARYVARLADCA